MSRDSPKAITWAEPNLGMVVRAFPRLSGVADGAVVGYGASGRAARLDATRLARGSRTLETRAVGQQVSQPPAVDGRLGLADARRRFSLLGLGGCHILECLRHGVDLPHGPLSPGAGR